MSTKTYITFECIGVESRTTAQNVRIDELYNMKRKYLLLKMRFMGKNKEDHSNPIIGNHDYTPKPALDKECMVCLRTTIYRWKGFIKSFPTLSCANAKSFKFVV